MNKVVAADTERIAIAGNDPNAEFRPCELEASRKSWCTSMDGVNAVRVNVIGKSATATDAGDKHSLLRWNTNFWQYLLHLRKDRIIAATWAPSDILIAGEVFGLENREYSAHCVLMGCNGGRCF